MGAVVVGSVLGKLLEVTIGAVLAADGMTGGGPPAGAPLAEAAAARAACSSR
jgi:hypothetical protein